MSEQYLPRVYALDPGCTVESIDLDEAYIGVVNGVVPYGIFVDLSDAVSGLVHASRLHQTYDVGEQVIVTVEEIHENGDIALDTLDVDAYELVERTPDIDPARIETVSAGDQNVLIEGRVDQIKQTSGPTIFYVTDGSHVIGCAAFEAAGVRAFSEIHAGDIVRISGDCRPHDGDLQIEVARIDQVEDADASEIQTTIDERTADRAEPHDVEPLVEWEALVSLQPGLTELARDLRRAILESRPVRIRHHADGDGMCAAVPITQALERFANRVHLDSSNATHLISRAPSRAPFYEMEDATRDLNFALEDREKHGQQLPLLLMLDNGSTAEDVPAYETLAHYDIPIVAIDHHHPDPEAVEDSLDAHVNPYLHDEDYRITTGMLCVELARMIAPELTEDLQHVPAIAGLADRSKANAMERYIELAAQKGYDETRLQDVSEALDYAAFWLRYNSGDRLIQDILEVGDVDEDHHRELVAFFAERAREEVDEQLGAAMAHVEHEVLENDVHLYRIDVENYAHRFTYPAPGKTTGEIHDRKIEDTGGPVITVGYGPDFAVLRSDGVRLDIPRMVSELEEEIPGGGVSGGGHLVVGSIKFVKGKREEVVDALIEKMAEADIDEALSSAALIDDD